MTQDRSRFELENTRRDLIAMRVRHGADTPIGHRCSNLIEQLKNFQWATGDQLRALEKAIQQSMDDPAKITAVGRQGE